MDLGLEDRTVLVTGASRGIGRAVSEMLTAEGAQVFAVARDADSLRTLAEPHGDAMAWHDADLSTDAGCQESLDAALDWRGPVDVLVNCAGDAQMGDLMSLSANTSRTRYG